MGLHASQTQAANHIAVITVKLQSTQAEGEILWFEHSLKTLVIDPPSIRQATAAPSTSTLPVESHATSLRMGGDSMPPPQSILLPNPKTGGSPWHHLVPPRVKPPKYPDTSNSFGGTPPPKQRSSHFYMSDFAPHLGQDKQKMNNRSLKPGLLTAV